MEASHYRIAWIGCRSTNDLQQAFGSRRLVLVHFPSVTGYLTDAADYDAGVVLDGQPTDAPLNDARRLLRMVWQERRPPAPILVLANPTLDDLQRAWRFGWVDVICNPLGDEQLVERVVAAARKWWPLGQALLASRSSAQRECQLSLREWQLCNLLAQGKNLKWIAARWGLSPNTLRNQRNRALQKLQLESDCELAHLWTTHRWLEQLRGVLCGEPGDSTISLFCPAEHPGACGSVFTPCPFG